MKLFFNKRFTLPSTVSTSHSIVSKDLRVDLQKSWQENLPFVIYFLSVFVTNNLKLVLLEWVILNFRIIKVSVFWQYTCVYTFYFTFRKITFVLQVNPFFSSISTIRRRWYLRRGRIVIQYSKDLPWITNSVYTMDKIT